MTLLATPEQLPPLLALPLAEAAQSNLGRLDRAHAIAISETLRDLHCLIPSSQRTP